MMDFLFQELKELREKGLYRNLRTITGPQEPRVIIGGRECLLFSSNNYLGLANHPRLKKASQEAIERYGVGAGASRLISGTMELHTRLEEKIARFKGRESAILFSSGFLANLGVITSLLGREDVVIVDRLNHASIIDAARLSSAKLLVYPHRDMSRLKKILERCQPYKKRLIVTDSIFSMDGDLAPLPEIVSLAKRYRALVMIDEAHATGVLGSGGRGAEEHFGLEGKVDIVMGTLSKAIGSLGGFITGSQNLIEYLKNRARSFIYTTALPSGVCAASLAGLDLIENEPSLRKNLWQNVKYIRDRLLKMGFDLMGSETQIIPILIGEVERTMEISEYLFSQGIFIP
ncbi:MAG TPA: 8-amino-7-oxononanoate synthase, partial [bacterium]|nr:8-amino-7-oxononanoate synthase [bacterium]